MTLTRRHFLASMSSMAGLATLPFTVADASAAVISFRQAFAKPPNQAKPWIRWWWPGGAVDDDELRREVKLLSSVGFGGAEIQAFNPGIPNLSKEQRTRLHDYANEAFFSHVKVCADEAKQQDIQIDMTFGSAWPSGGGFAITPELALIELTTAITSVQANASGPIQVNIPKRTSKLGAFGSLDSRNRDPRANDWKRRIAAREKIVAVIAFKAEAPVLENNKNYRVAIVKSAGKVHDPAGIVLTDKLQSDGLLDWTPPNPGSWQIVTFKQFVADSPVLAGVGDGPQLVLDHFNRDAFEAHARRVGLELVRGGAAATAMRATFVDSLELMPDIYWSENFLAEFRSRRRYDLTPFMPHILQPGWMESWNPHVSLPYFDAADTGDRVRADYRLTISELLIENFFKPFVEWNRRHGLSARVQAHGAPSDLLQSYGLADIPETEDLESSDDPHFRRLARSAANLYGRNIVSCESLCWPRRPFEITPAQWHARVNLLFASGVNAIVMHGFPYALHKEAWPGWYPFAPSPFIPGFSSMINEANPLWNSIESLNGYISRVQSILQSGSNVVPVAVYLGDSTYFHGIEQKETHDLLEHLLNDGFDYDRVNDHSLGKCTVSNGKLVAQSGMAYSALILPARASIAASTASHLARFAKANLPIFFADRPPSRANGYNDHASQDERVRSAVQTALNGSARIVPAARVTDTLRLARIRANLTFRSEPCLFIEKNLNGRSAYFLHNPKTKPMNVVLSAQAVGYPEIWDPHTGAQTAARANRMHGMTEVSVDIPAGDGVLLVFGDRRLSQPLGWNTIDSIDLTFRSWKANVDGHGKGGRVVKLELNLEGLQDWRMIDGLNDFSGCADYRLDVTLPSDWFQSDVQVVLELGAVHDMAIVTVGDGRNIVVYAPPFDLDLTDMLRPAVNQLQISIFNNPNNALIDPKKPGLKTLTPKPAGLLGPVRLVRKKPTR